MPFFKALLTVDKSLSKETFFPFLLFDAVFCIFIAPSSSVKCLMCSMLCVCVSFWLDVVEYQVRDVPVAGSAPSPPTMATANHRGSFLRTEL